MRTFDIIRASAILLFAVAACGDDETTASGTNGAGGAGGTGSGAGAGGSGTGGELVVPTLRISGTAVDFEGGAAITGSATVTTMGLTPPPTVSVTGADFVIEGVAPFSVFHVLSGSPPNYRSTYNVATEVMDVDVTGLKAEVVAEAYLTALGTAFNVVSMPNTGLIIARAVDEAGAPKEGVPGSAFAVNGAPPPTAPRFLDATKLAAPALTATSASGYVVFYNVPTGLVTIGAATGGGFTVVGASAPTAATAVTLATLTVTEGGPVLPVNVSFANDVVPIFTARGCTACHSGNSPGADLGKLSLNTGDNSVYKELTEELSPTYNTTRVNLAEPPKSLVLTMPSFEFEPDPHPNATFVSPSDPDYLILLAWITEGAKQN